MQIMKMKNIMKLIRLIHNFKKKGWSVDNDKHEHKNVIKTITVMKMKMINKKRWKIWKWQNWRDYEHDKSYTDDANKEHDEKLWK